MYFSKIIKNVLNVRNIYGVTVMSERTTTDEFIKSYPKQDDLCANAYTDEPNMFD